MVATSGMFGNRFGGAQTPYGTPPIAPTSPETTPGAGYGVPTAQPSSPSFFGQGGVGRGIAGTIGDYLLQQAHMQPIYAPAMEQARKFHEQQVMAMQKQQAEMYAPREVGGNLVQMDHSGSFKTLYSAPKQPQQDEFDRSAARLGIMPGSKAYLDAAQMNFDNHNDPAQIVSNGDGSYTPVLRSQMRGSGGAPQKPVGKLTLMPSMSPTQGGATLGGASTSHTMSSVQAAQMLSSFGPNGQAAFQGWLTKNNIRIAD